MPRIEVLPTGTSIAQPGYAFVPDTRPVPQATSQPISGRKRAPRNAGTGFGDTTVRQQNAVLKHLADLDRDSNRDVQVPIPKEAAGRAAKSKTTPNVRRIMMSQKTFANHLADEEAALAQKTASTSQTPTNPRRASVTDVRSTVHETSNMVEDPLEADPLLRTYVPSAPSSELMQMLVTAPSLSYNAARATQSDSRRPQRYFCEICGYWGNVRCMKCGARICGLDCKGAHDEGRCLKFYA